MKSHASLTTLISSFFTPVKYIPSGNSEIIILDISIRHLAIYLEIFVDGIPTSDNIRFWRFPHFEMLETKLITLSEESCRFELRSRVCNSVQGFSADFVAALQEAI